MSGHLIGCVKDVKGLGKSHKLALIAFADSADDRTHIAFPGYDGVRAWADCSRSRAAELIADLVTEGYLRQHSAARPGKRAEYVVFPNGCCDAHRTPEDDVQEQTPEQLAVWVRDTIGIELDPWQAVVFAAQYASRNGSEISDPSSVNGSEVSDPSDAETPAAPDGDANGSEIPDAMGPASRTRTGVRVQNGSEAPDPFTTSNTNPPTPASGGAGCARHTNGTGTNCRGCGTTNRQLADAKRKAEAKRRREQEQARIAAERQAAAAARVASEDRAPEIAKAARQGVQAGRAAFYGTPSIPGTRSIVQAAAAAELAASRDQAIGRLAR